jgi:hypothetical protein
VGGVTGARMAQGIRQTGMEIAGGGPKNAAQFMVMRQLFGYRGGGTKDFFEAQVAASQGKVSGGGVEALLGSLTKGKDKYANAMQVQQFFKQIGVDLGPEQAMSLAGGDKSARDKAQQMLGVAAKRNFTSADIMAQGAAPGGMQTQAALDNATQRAGSAALAGVQALDRAQVEMMGNAAKFSETIKMLGDNATNIAKLMGPGAKDLADLLENLVLKVMGP